VCFMWVLTYPSPRLEEIADTVHVLRRNHNNSLLFHNFVIVTSIKSVRCYGITLIKIKQSYICLQIFIWYEFIGLPFIQSNSKKSQPCKWCNNKNHKINDGPTGYAGWAMAYPTAQPIHVSGTRRPSVVREQDLIDSPDPLSRSIDQQTVAPSRLLSS
jgi:hypothetical protein